MCFKTVFYSCRYLIYKYSKLYFNKKLKQIDYDKTIIPYTNNVHITEFRNKNSTSVIIKKLIKQ